VFGGDGASFVVPPTAVKPVASAIQGTREMAADVFGLTLRAGIVPITEVQSAGHKTNIAKYKLSEKIMIAMFDGDGLAYAEDLIKDPEKEDQYDIRNRIESYSPTADFSGLECRWNPVRATRGEILTLMVRATGADSAGTYKDLFVKVQDIYGEKENYRPTKQESLSLAFQPKYLKQEHGVPILEIFFSAVCTLSKWSLKLCWALYYSISISVSPMWKGKNMSATWF